MGCHGEIEANPEWAERDGFRVRQGMDPGSVPIRTRWGWMILERDGTARKVRKDDHKV